jgi:predicted small integral membrane protein
VNALPDTENNEVPIAILEAEEESRQTDADTKRTGFLPIVTNWFDRLFISVVVWVALELFWMRFVEQSIPLWGAHAIAIILAIIIIRKG